MIKPICNVMNCRFIKPIIVIFQGLQDFGVIRFAICVQSLKQCHTEKRRGRRIIKTKQWKSRRHRRCIERRSLFANSISLNTKRLSQNSYQEFVRYTSVALCAVGTSVTLCVISVPSVTLCAYYIRLSVYHSIFRKNHNLFLCHLFCKLFFVQFKSNTCSFGF